MELPISIIVTLFVALAVGSMIIALANRWLVFNPPCFGPNCQGQDQSEERLKYQATITASQIASYVRLCHEHVLEKPKFDNYICYAITLENPVSVNPAEVASQLPADANWYKVDAGTTRSISIFWNYANNIVEVRV